MSVYMSIYNNTAYFATKPIEEINGRKADCISTDIDNGRHGENLGITLSNYINKCVITEPISPRSTAYYFSNMQMKEIEGLELLDTSNVSNMQYMFSKCWSLENLDLSHFNTENVCNTDYMFQDCSKLKSLDLSNFNTINIETMQGMFRDCSLLGNLQLPDFDVNKIDSFHSIYALIQEGREVFKGCNKLYKANGYLPDKEMVTTLSEYTLELQKEVFLNELNKLEQSNNLFRGTVTINNEDFNIKIDTQTQLFGMTKTVDNNERVLTPDENQKIAQYVSEIRDIVYEALEKSKNAIFIKDLTEVDKNKFNATLILNEKKYKMEIDTDTRLSRYYGLGEDGKQFDLTEKDTALIKSYASDISATIKNVLERQQKMKEASAPSLEDKINAAKNKKAEKSINATTKVKKDIER